MAILNLPHFGPINLDALEEYYAVSIPYNGNEIEIDLNFEEESITPEAMDEVLHFIEQINVFDAQNKTYLEVDFNDDEGEAVKIYLEHHLEELEKNELESLIDFNKVQEEPIKQLLGKLRLVRLGLYPHQEEFFATFDYSIGSDLTDYLIAVSVDKDGHFQDINMDS